MAPPPPPSTASNDSSNSHDSSSSAGTTITSRSVDGPPKATLTFPERSEETLPLLQARKPPPKKISPMDKAHVLDWDTLNLGHPRASKRTVHISDMDVHVWGMDEMEPDLPIGIVIVAHGFANKARDMESMASGLIGEIGRLHAVGGRRQTRSVLVATLDQRNHGERRRIRDGKVWGNNPARILSAAASIYGGMMDHQYLMKLLPSFLFPRGEREVVEFMSTGFSMGGHVCWRLLREDPRIRIGIPMCSLPSESLGYHFVQRADLEAKTETWLPPDMHSWLATQTPRNTYTGKKILSLHGGLDALNPISSGIAKWREIVANAETAEDCEMWVDEHRGHVVSPGMVERAAEWLWRWGFSEA